MNTQHYQQKAFHPFGERLANLEHRSLNLRAQLDLIALYSEEIGENQLDDQRRQWLQMQFPPAEGIDFDQISRVAGLLLSPARAQLSAVVLALREAEQGILHCLTRCKELLKQGNVDSAVRELIQLEQVRLQPAEKIIELVRRVVDQRLKGSNAIRNVAYDLMAGQIFEEINGNLMEDKTYLEGLVGLPSLLLESGSAFEVEQWETAARAMTSIGYSLPVSLQACEDSHLPQVWNSIRFCFPICRQIVTDLGLLSEILSSAQGFGASVQNPEVSRLCRIWGEDILAEVLATLIGGPAYVGANIETMAYSTSRVLQATRQPMGVPSYLRWELQFSVLTSLGFHAEAENYKRLVYGVYGPPSFAVTVYGSRPVLAEFISLTPQMVHNILGWNLHCFQGGSVRQCLPEFGVDQYSEAKKLSEAVSAAPNLTSPSSFWALSEVAVQSGNSSNGSGAEKKETKSSQVKSESAKTSQTTPSIVTVAAGCRLAFERISTQSEVPSGFAGSCYQMLISALKASAQREEIGSSRRLTAHDMRRLSRKMRSRPIIPVQPGTGMM